MRALVTGANGFVGRHLVRLLQSSGHTVFEAGHGAAISADFRIPEHVEELVGQLRPDVIFHLAATSSLTEMARDPTGGAANIVTPAVNVFKHAGAARVVLVSSAVVYGRGATGEAEKLRPVDVYGSARASVEYMAQVAVKQGTDIVIARPFPHTGPGQDRRFALGDWAARHEAGERRIPVGNLDVRRDYSDVRDIVAGYLLLAERGARGEAYNLASGVTRTMGELFARVCPDAEPVVDPRRVRAKDLPELSGTATKIEALGWRRFYRIDDTLADLRRSTRNES